MVALGPVHTIYGPDGRAIRRWTVEKFTNARLVRLGPDGEPDPDDPGVPLPGATMVRDLPIDNGVPCVRPLCPPRQVTFTLTLAPTLTPSQYRGAVEL